MFPQLPNNLNKQQEKRYLHAWWNIFNLVLGTIKAILLVVCGVFIFTLFGNPFDFNWQQPIPATNNSSSNQIAIADEDWDKIENGIHLRSGLVYAEHFDLIRANCTACHSGKLVAQNRATREGWEQMIRWMQETQGLWDLGKNEPIILDYLAKYYAPQETGRRAHLDMKQIEWYILDLEE